jgi:two-component system cell cycle sensor histidine kinase/response regulator CckA
VTGVLAGILIGVLAVLAAGLFVGLRRGSAAEAALRASQERFDQLSAVIDEVFWMTDPAKTQMLYVSPAYERIWGRTCASLIASPMSWVDAIHPDDRARILAAAGRQGVDSFDQTYRIVRPDGSHRWIRDRAFPIRDAAGVVVRIAGVAADVTELRASHELFQRVFAANPAGMALRRQSDGKMVEINDSFCRIVGVPRDAIIGTTTAEWDPIENRAELERRHVEGGGHVAGAPMVLRDESGRRRILMVSLESLEIGGEPHLLTIGIDATERLESERRFEQLTAAIDEVFWVTDVDKTRIVYVSPGYERIWGRSAATLYAVPSDWREAIHPDDVDRVVAAVRAQGARYEETYRIRRPDGTIRWIHDRAFAMRDADGMVTGVCGVAADITDTRELEAELRQTQKLESIGMLAGGVAHDFNNLLTVVSTCADEIGMALPDDDPLREVVDEVRDAVARGSALTRQLLAFSRRQMIEPRRLHLDAILTETDKLLRRLLGEDITLTTRLHRNLPAVFADAGQLTQVLVNLAVNARDAMPRGGALLVETSQLEVVDPARFRGHLAAGHYVVLTVVDTGCGMTDDVRAHLFEPFFTTKGPGRGTGLGLSVTHGIIKQSGGHIEVESTVGAGTRFTIYLPVAPGEPAPEVDVTAAEMHGGNELILVVEDQATVRRAIGRILRARGYRVLEAADGRRALEMLGEIDGAADLVVTDIVMPEMDGRELAEAARQRWRELAFLFTSGYTGDEIVRRGVLQTEIDFLQKPFDAHALLARVRVCLDQSSGSAR